MRASFRKLMVGVLAASGCADADADGPSITDPATAFPRMLSELGAIAGEAFAPAGPHVFDYEVAYPLWSSGSSKARQLVLPSEAAIDAADRDAWQFATGTVAFKTFVANGRALETRAIRKLDTEWEYVVYLWDGDDAELLATELSVPIDLGDGAVHTVPAPLQCRQCHETAASPLLGVNELQLADELPRLAQAFASGPPDDPARIDHPDPRTAGVLGWFVGNCTHCHNGGDTDNASFDLAPAVALANTIDVPTESSATASGMRIVPGDPSASVLYLAVSGDHEDPELEDMPPIGIDRRDTAAIAELRTMIEELAP